MKLAIIAAAMMTITSGQRVWTVQWIPDGLLLHYETGGHFPTPHEATVAAQKFLRMQHLDCTAEEAESTRAPGYAVSVNCPKTGHTAEIQIRAPSAIGSALILTQ